MDYTRQWAFVADMNHDGVVTISDAETTAITSR